MKKILSKHSRKKTILILINKHLKIHWIFYILTFALVLLLFKNPFSGKNDISNLEPFPDALLYLTASKNLAHGNGLKIYYHDVKLASTIPPLYPIIITPFYAILNDPRGFYFANVLMSLVSAVFFYKMIFKLINHALIRLILFTAFVSNTIVFWYPSVAMAENLLICLFIVSIYCLTSPPSLKKSLYLGFITIAFFATKYVAWTLSFSLILTYTALIITQRTNQSKKLKLLSLFFFSLLTFFSLLMLLETITKEQNFFLQLVGSFLNHVELALQPLLSIFPSLAQTQNNIPIFQSKAAVNLFFSYAHINNNLLMYFAGLIGGEAPVAGRSFNIIPILIGMGSLIGILINPFISRQKILNFYLLISFLTTFIFILFFVVADTRYLFSMIPVQIIAFGITLNALFNFLKAKKLVTSWYLIITICYVTILWNIYPAVRTQISLNFFIDNPSKNYQTVIFYNQYFDKVPDKKPFIITTLPPLLIDFYSNNNYNYLPFSRYQHFIEQPQVWDIPENSYLFGLYDKYLSEGKEIYLSDYQANSFSYSQAYLIYKENFNLTEVASGYQNKWKLFKLGSKKLQ